MLLGIGRVVRVEKFVIVVKETNVIAKPKMVLPTKEDIERARVRGAAAAICFAEKVKYEAGSRALVFVLKSGVVLSIPVHRVSHLAELTPTQLAKIRLVPPGAAIEIREIDLDLSVPGLIREALGFDEARRGGSATKAKAKASRADGAKVGRSRKEREAVELRSRRSIISAHGDVSPG